MHLALVHDKVETVEDFPVPDRDLEAFDFEKGHAN
jgi:hypothetical protein